MSDSNDTYDGIPLNEKMTKVVLRLEDKYLKGGNNKAYLYGRLLGLYAMLKMIYHRFDRKMKKAQILTTGKRCPQMWLASEDFKKSQLYIDRGVQRNLTNYRCFEYQFKAVFSDMGDWGPRRLTMEETASIMRGWHHQNLFNDKMDGFIRAKNYARREKETEQQAS